MKTNTRKTTVATSMEDIGEAIEETKVANEGEQVSQISETQEAVLNDDDVRVVDNDLLHKREGSNDDVIEGMETSAPIESVDNPPFDVGIKPATDEEYVELSEMFDNKDISDSDMKDHVVSGFISQEQYASITGNDYEPEHHGRADHLLVMRKDLTDRIAKGDLNVDGAIALIDSRVVEKVISESDAKWLKMALASNAKDDPKLLEIKENYKPANSTLEEAKVAGTKAALDIIVNDVETKTTRAARFTLALADMAYHYMSANRLPVSAKVHETLWSLIRKDELLGPIVTKKDADERFESETNPYSDPAILSLRVNSLKAACLLAYGVVTGVQFGVIPKEFNRKGRLDRSLVFDAVNGESDETHFRAVCIPLNRIMPNVTKPKSKTEVDPATRKSVPYLLAEIQEECTDKTLRMLPPEAVVALFDYYFGDEASELQYDMRSDNMNRAPTGWIVAAKVPGSTTTGTTTTNGEAQSRDTGGTQSAGNAEDRIDIGSGKKMTMTEIATAVRERDQLLSAQAGDALSSIGALAALMRDTKLAVPENARLMFYDAAHAFVSRRVKMLATAPSKVEATAAVNLMRELERIFVWDEDKNVYEYYNADNIVTGRYEV